MHISYEIIITSYVYRWNLINSDSHIIKFLNPDAKFSIEVGGDLVAVYKLGAVAKIAQIFTQLHQSG